MPELPEVEIVKRGLSPALLNKTITRVVLNRPDLRFPIPATLKGVLEGQVVQNLQRRGKYILGFMDSGAGFVLHLGMSGVIKIDDPGVSYEAKKHDHVIFEMSDGGRVVFNDARRFGSLLQTHQETWAGESPFSKMGPEPLDNSFNGPALKEVLSSRRGSIKAALLDQAVVAGVGNIYACEALFMAGISPERAACDLLDDEAESLAAAIKGVLAEAIEAGGSSLRDYRNTKGDLGYFQHHFSVYDREGHACPGCQCDIIVAGGVKRIVQSGRSTFFCPQVQK